MLDTLRIFLFSQNNTEYVRVSKLRYISVSKKHNVFSSFRSVQINTFSSGEKNYFQSSQIFLNKALEKKNLFEGTKAVLFLWLLFNWKKVRPKQPLITTVNHFECLQENTTFLFFLFHAKSNVVPSTLVQRGCQLAIYVHIPVFFNFSTQHIKPIFFFFSLRTQ